MQVVDEDMPSAPMAYKRDTIGSNATASWYSPERGRAKLGVPIFDRKEYCKLIGVGINSDGSTNNMGDLFKH